MHARLRIMYYICTRVRVRACADELLAHPVRPSCFQPQFKKAGLFTPASDRSISGASSAYSLLEEHRLCARARIGLGEPDQSFTICIGMALFWQRLMINAPLFRHPSWGLDWVLGLGFRLGFRVRVQAGVQGSGFRGIDVVEHIGISLARASSMKLSL